MRRSLSWSGMPLGVSTPLPANIATPIPSQVKQPSNLYTPNLSTWSPLPINFNNITAPKNVVETSGNESHLIFLQNIISKQQSTIQLLAEHLNRLEVKLETIAAHPPHTQSSSQHVSTINPNLVDISGNSINDSILEKLKKAPIPAPISNQNIVDIPDDSLTNGTKEDWQFDRINTNEDWNFPIKYAKRKSTKTWQPSLSNSFANLSFAPAREEIEHTRDQEPPKGSHKQAAHMQSSNSEKRRPVITTNEKHLNKYVPPKYAPGPFSYSEVANKNYNPSSAADPNKIHKPTVTVFCDSIPKHVSAYHLSKETGTRASIKAFPGTNSRKLNLHMAIEIENNAPNIAIVHVGSNDLANNVPQKQIIENIRKIVQTLRNAGTKHIFISGLIGR